MSKKSSPDKKKQKTESPPIPEPLSVDYAPTGRAACKKCQSPIGDGSVRVGRLVRSRFHDGFDTQLMHWRCGCEYGNSLDDFKGWQSQLRWGGPNDDVERLMKTFGEEFIDQSSSGIVEEYKKQNQLILTATLHIADAPVALLRQVFEANDMVFSDRLKAIDLARVIADQIFFGKLPPCPTCNTNGLRQSGTDIRCSGWFSASTKCEFKFRIINLIKGRPAEFGGIAVGDELMTSRLARNSNLVIPEDVAQHKAFKTLIIPKEIQAIRKKIASGSGTSIGARGGGIASSVMSTLDSEDEDMQTTEPAYWLTGMKFTLCGIDHVEAEELRKKISKFGGVVLEDVIVAGPDRTTHLVIAEDELFKDPKSAKYRKCNDAGIPIVKVDFINFATDESTANLFAAARNNSREGTTETSYPSTIEVSGRSKKKPNAIINGKYNLVTDMRIADRLVYKKDKDEKCPDLYIFYSVSRGKWKISPSTEDGKGHVAINNDSKSERPDLCCEKNWEVFDGKDKGFSVDDDVNVKVRKRKLESDRTVEAVPAGPFLRQRKFLKSYIVEGSVGKKLPTIKECLMSQAGIKNRKKRPSPKGGSPIVTVDEEVSVDLRDPAIYVDVQNNVYNVLLTKTDAGTNVNKFYAIQLIGYNPKRSTSAKGASNHYAVFRKWGRFGYTGNAPMNGSMTVDYGADKTGAIEAFRGKFTECTGLEFDVRDIAPQKPGRYAYVELQGQAGGEETSTKKQGKKKQSSTTPSEMDKQLQELIELIFDLEMIEREMSKSMDIDTSRLPPSALSKRQLSQGLSVLREIEGILSPQIEEVGEDFAVGQKENILDGPTRQLKLRDCSNRFYTIVPHCFDRKQFVPIIETVRVLKKLIRNIEDLTQIVELEEIRSSSILAQNQAPNQRPLVDVQYDELGCKIEVVQTGSVEYDLITKAISETHAATHDTYKMRVGKIFKVERPGEASAFSRDPCQDNKRMLWHGSRLSNWASILKHGLRIAPKEAPVSGYMFGKGVYFADSSSKSANYCFATEEEPDGMLVLCNVAVGTQYKRLEAQYEASSKSKKKGCDSTWGVGASAPLEHVVLPHGGILPTGKVVDNTAAIEEAKLDWPRGKASLLYNEFIVYRESQVRMEYIVHVKFDFVKGR